MRAPRVNPLTVPCFSGVTRNQVFDLWLRTRLCALQERAQALQQMANRGGTVQQHALRIQDAEQVRGFDAVRERIRTFGAHGARRVPELKRSAVAPFLIRELHVVFPKLLHLHLNLHQSASILCAEILAATIFFAGARGCGLSSPKRTMADDTSVDRVRASMLAVIGKKERLMDMRCRARLPALAAVK